MILTGKCREQFNNWRFNIKKDKRDSYHTGVNDLVVLNRIEEWLSTRGFYLFPTPITGNKNGYDSFPILGWETQIIVPSDIDMSNQHYAIKQIINGVLVDTKTINFIEKNSQIQFESILDSKKDTIKKLNDYFNSVDDNNYRVNKEIEVE